MHWKEKLKLWLLKNNVKEHNKKEIKRVFSGLPENEDPEAKKRRQKREVARLQERLASKITIEPDSTGRSIRG